MNRKLLFLTFSLMFLCVSVFAAESGQNNVTINELTLEQRKAARIELLQQMMSKYENNQTFAKVQDYMEAKYQFLHKSHPPRTPSVVIQETFKRTQSLMDHTRPYIGNSFTRIYDPVQIEKNVNKYIWLKGLCFIILGINDEHRIALSYFYQPENQDLKQEFLKDVVIYSFPEVLDVPENKQWQSEMMIVMDKLGYKIFNIKKFVKNENP
ncbi:MAG TPA: hypothetical protein DDW65_20390 [Firmicutes bacterium]|jgi:hypothetical protein|nr:hypothetical protein [Bacillota bacterium]